MICNIISKEIYKKKIYPIIEFNCIYIINCLFFNCYIDNLNEGGAFYIETINSSYFINYNSFFNCTAYRGGAFKLITTNGNISILKNCGDSCLATQNTCFSWLIVNGKGYNHLNYTSAIRCSNILLLNPNYVTIHLYGGQQISTNINITNCIITGQTPSLAFQFGITSFNQFLNLNNLYSNGEIIILFQYFNEFNINKMNLINCTQKTNLHGIIYSKNSKSFINDSNFFYLDIPLFKIINSTLIIKNSIFDQISLTSDLILNNCITNQNTLITKNFECFSTFLCNNFQLITHNLKFKKKIYLILLRFFF